MNLKNAIILISIFIGLISFTSCEGDDNPAPGCIKGEGTVTTSTLSVAEFSGIELAISSNVTINQGATQKVEATGHPNIIDKIITSVSNGVWKIDFEDGCYEDFELSIEITIPSINQLDVSGSGDLLVNNFSNQTGELSADINGSGNITLNDFEGITNFDASLTGSGSFTGNSDIASLETFSLTISGSGEYLGFEISSDDCVVNSLGSGNSELTAQNSLNVTLTGSGDVSYKGSATLTSNVTGSGRVIDRN